MDIYAKNHPGPPWPPHFHDFHILTDSLEQAKLDLIHCCQLHGWTSCEQETCLFDREAEANADEQYTLPGTLGTVLRRGQMYLMWRRCQDAASLDRHLFSEVVFIDGPSGSQGFSSPWESLMPPPSTNPPCQAVRVCAGLTIKPGEPGFGVDYINSVVHEGGGALKGRQVWMGMTFAYLGLGLRLGLGVTKCWYWEWETVFLTQHGK